MLKSPVTSMSARNGGTTRFLTGSTPSTWSASSSSRILRAPRSAVIAVPATPASTIAVTNGANSRIEASTKNPPSRARAGGGGAARPPPPAKRARGDQGRNPEKGGEQKTPAEPVQRPEQDEEVR